MPVHGLRGPFASLEAYCAQRRRDDDWVRSCTVERQEAHTAALVTRAAGGQRAVLLAVEDAGWWVDEGEDPSVGLLFDGNRDRGSFVIVGLGDSNGGARLRAVQSHWHKSESDGHDVYYCFALEVHCYASALGGLSCTHALPVAGRRDCGLGDEESAARFDATRWDWQQEITNTSDGKGLEIRRLAWRHFPTRFDGYTDWMRETAASALSLAGRYPQFMTRWRPKGVHPSAK